MSKNRIKTKIQQIKSREEAETAMNELALTTLNKNRFIADLDEKILAAQEEAADNIAACEKTIKEKFSALRAWAEANPDEFGKKKSIDFATGVLGFRTGTPKLALLNRSWNWEKVTEAVCRILPNFTRNKPEVDKDAIIGQRNDEAIKAVLDKCGMKVVQDEGFFVDPKLTKAETKVAEAA